MSRVGLIAAPLVFLPIGAEGQITGFAAPQVDAQLRAETILVEAIQPPVLQELNHDMSVEPHVSGSAAQGRVRDYLVRRLREWAQGLIG